MQWFVFYLNVKGFKRISNWWQTVGILTLCSSSNHTIISVRELAIVRDRDREWERERDGKRER